MQKIKTYIISGLAADERVFRHIRLPAGFEAVHLRWLHPQKNESLHAYAMRMMQSVEDRQPFVLIGLSFGGMLVTEIAKRLNPLQTILISSVPSSAHLPWYYRLAGGMRLQKFIPVPVIKSASLIKRFFTTETSEDKMLLQAIIKDSDPAFIKWALDAILHWKNEAVPEDLVHIHGTGDEVLPVRYTEPTHLIEKAGHLLVLNRSEEVNLILKNSLLPLTES